MTPTIRDATEHDLDAINRIYNDYVLHSTCTFDETPVTAEARLAWWRERAGRYPLLVLENAGEVIGWASLFPFRPRSGYRYTLEDSIYLDSGVHGRGLGRMLLEALLSPARRGECHTLIAGMTADQIPSMRLHAALGFREVARLSQVGFKFGRWLDVVFMQKML